MNTKENINPKEYFYKEGQNVEIDGRLLLDIIEMTEVLLNQEVKVESKFKYDYVNEKGDVVKNVTKNNVDKLKKIVNFNKTIDNPTFEYSITDKGVAYAGLKKLLESVHYSNIQSGNAIHYKELMPNQPQSN